MLRAFIGAFVLAFCTVVPTAVSAQADPVRIEPSPGTYGNAVTVTCTSENTDAELYYRFSNSTTERWVPYLVPINLPATRGTERSYTVEIGMRGDEGISSLGSRTYTIDRRAPEKPAISLISADEDDIRIDFEKIKGESLRYWSSAEPERGFTDWTGEEIILNRTDVEEFPLTVKAYTRDEAGNRSPLAGRTFVQPIREEKEPELNVPSPVEGTFVNPQLLYIKNSDAFEWVRYTVNGDDPVYRGAVYDNPVLLRAKGSYTLRIAAKTARGNTLRLQRDFSIEGEGPLYFEFKSGTLKRPRPIEPPDRKNGYVLYYTKSDRMVTENDEFFREALPLFTEAPTLQHQQVRIGVLDPQSEEIFQYRYFFLYDNRVPGPPEIEPAGEVPFQKSLKIHMQGPEHADIYYTLDGSTPDEFSNTYDGPFELTAPEGVDTGSIRLQAVAQLRNDRRSPVISRLIEYDTRRPETPHAEIVERSSNTVTLRFSAGGARYYRFETAINARAQEPSLRSPRSSEELTLEFPRGLEAEVYLTVMSEDRAHNLSSGVDTLRFRVDSVPPEPPEVSMTDGTLEIKGNGTAFYRVTDAPRRELLPPHPGSGTEQFSRYEKTVKVEGMQGERRAFRAWAYVEDEAGNRSRIASSEVYTVDLRDPTVPEITGTTEKNLHNTPTTVSLSSRTGIEAIEYRLTSAQGRAEPVFDENADFQAYTGALRLSGEEGKRTVYLLEYRSRISDGGEASTVQRERFVIDRDPPPPPALTGVQSGVSYSRPVFIHSGVTEGRVFIWAATKGELEELSNSAGNEHGQQTQEKTDDSGPVNEARQLVTDTVLQQKGVPVSDGVLIDCPDNFVRHYTVYAATFDQAGNSTFLQEPIRFTIDRRPPPLPELKGVPAKGVTADDVKLTPEKGEYSGLRYTVATDNGIPPVPDASSPATNATLRFNGEDGKRVVYTLRYRAVDEAGNLSEKTGNLRWVIDRRTPRVPDIRAELIGPRSSFISLETPADRGSMYYSIDGSRFVEYSEPFFYSLEGPNERGEIRAYTESLTGIQSGMAEETCFDVPLASSLVEGIQNGRTYGENVTVHPRAQRYANGAELRYVLEVGKGPTVTTSPFSPLFPDDRLRLSALPGESITYRLGVGLHVPVLPNPLRRETYTVTVDKSAPPVPTVKGVHDGGYFTEERSISLGIPEGDGKIRYSLSERGEPAEPFRPYEDPIRIGGATGAMKEYRLSFYAVDAVDNRSQTRDIYFTIDQDGIYVSPAGSDRAAGGRKDPFRSLSRALREVQETDRTTIVLSEGDYSLHSPVSVERSLTIKGGYGNEDWRPTGNQSTISLDKDFPGNKTAFEVDGGKFKAERLLMNTSVRSGTMYQVKNGGTLDVSESTIVTGSVEDDTSIEVRSSSVRFLDSRIDVGPINGGHALSIHDGSILLQSASITGGTHPGTAGILALTQSAAQFEDAVIDPGKGRSLTAIELNGGSLDSVGSTLYAGFGSNRSIILDSSGAKVRMRRTSFLSERRDAEGHLLTGVLSEGDEITLNECSFRLRGYTGAVALKSSNSDLTIQGGTYRTAEQREFSYLVQTAGGSFNAENALFESGETFDNLMCELKQTAAQLRHMTLAHGGGERISAAFSYDGSELRIASSVIASERNGRSAALLLKKVPEDLAIENNLFSGWPVLLDLEGNAPVTTVDTLEEPGGPFSGEAPFSGNRQLPRNEIFENETNYRLKDRELRKNFGYSLADGQ